MSKVTVDTTKLPISLTEDIVPTSDKRKRVMARSIKLGHCVCDPRKPCPCPLLKEKNVCTCAGEHVPPETGAPAVRLTAFVRSAGCASKISQKDLHQVLAMLPAVEDPRLLVGTATADDAGVFRLTPQTTIVQTVDVFTPGVDDPFLFGRIAACNSLSDVYAMGGTPVTALSIIGFPIYALPHEAMAEILKGGMAVLDEAKTILLGGHSINDEEVKFGFAVTGLIDSERIITNAGARPGDALVLTKPLGTGIIALAHQIGRASPEAVAAASASMSTLNRAAAEIMVRFGATACTDVTGFGLLGHLARIARESHVTAEVWCDRLPLLPSALDYARQGIFSGANERNAEYSAAFTAFEADLGEETKAILLDAQTSGGLLIALPPGKVEEALGAMRASGVAHAAEVGRIVEASDGQIRVLGTAPRQARGAPPPAAATKPVGIPPGSSAKDNRPTETTITKSADKRVDECCEPGSGAPDQALKMFQGFMGTALQPGAVDVVTKELIAIALGLAVNCVPCSRIHIKKAKSMGISRAEMQEAASLAVAFAGCRAMMLWNQLAEELLDA